MAKVVIIMGSKGDLDWSKKIAKSLGDFGIESVLRIASAHKVPLKCYNIVKEYEKEDVIFITVAGRSNALSGFTDAQTHCPVIACPPYGDKFAGNDIYSSLRMPSGVAPMVITEAENAALAAAKIFAISDSKIKNKVIDYQNNNRETLYKDDEEIKHGQR
ncbi:MAG: 5-(carboxyamino)imidazole ribonucleotide mutase [Ignavibacteria bacterium]|nr:5-(carboxyamino)imidazole ribonucleotide mutase [Ignavibacteria bacterium]